MSISPFWPLTALARYFDWAVRYEEHGNTVVVVIVVRFTPTVIDPVWQASP